MATYPEGIGTFLVTGRLTKGIADSADEGLEPDLVPIVGAEVTFTPNVPLPILRVPSVPVTIYQEKINATTDEDGYLIGVDETDRGIRLLYGGDTGIEPSGWTWGVRIKVGTFPDQVFSIAGSDGGTVDLTTAVHVPSNPGSELAAWEAAVDQVASLLNRRTATFNGDGSGSVPLGAGWRVYSVETDRPARVRLYASEAHRDADIARPVGTDPTGDHGLLLETVTTEGLLTVGLSPVVDGYTVDGTPTVHFHITAPDELGPVETTITYLRTEA